MPLMLIMLSGVLVFLPCTAIADTVSLTGRVNISGVAAGAVCSMSVNSAFGQGGVVDFGVYHKSNHSMIKSFPLSLVLHEDGAVESGCSTFLSGEPLVSITFGDAGGLQLDNVGIVTYGAGDKIRIEMIATDREASTQDPITVRNNIVKYEKNFAAKGMFGFLVTPRNFDMASVGKFHGRLSVMVTYQ